MSQPLTVVAEVDPPSAGIVRTRTRDWRTRAIDEPWDHGIAPPLHALLPDTHFMSLSMFEDQHWDPLLVIECNVDGTADAHWEALDRSLGAELRPILSCTKSARLPQWRDVFVDGSNRPLAPFLAAHAVAPVAWHAGNPGMTVERIQREAALFEQVQAHLATAPVPATAAAVHLALRSALMPANPWLGEPTAPRPVPAHAQAVRTVVMLVAALIAVVAIATLAIVFGPSSARWIAATLVAVMTLAIGAGAVQLRRLEASDPVQDCPGTSPDETAIQAREDRLFQNHLASMVAVKPGLTRAVLIRAATFALRLGVLASAPDGWLGQMRTIHFAQWCLVQNGGRLLFLSNYDGTWDSYLDDFINKARQGLTAAWTNCVGFPHTRWLISEGAADGRRFRAWARQSQRESLFWFNAYKNLTVNQIERNWSLADGLCHASMTEQEAAVWAKLL